MDEMPACTLFQDVAAVQHCLEDLKILDFDANRIYELLEENEKSPRRVDLVVETIRGLIGIGFTAGDYDVLSPDVVEVDDASDDSYDSIKPHDMNIVNHLGSLISEQVNRADMPSIKTNPQPVVIGETLETYRNDMTIFSEALKIQETVPCRLEDIKKALNKHISSRNRVQIATRQLMYETIGTAENGVRDGIHCPAPHKKPKPEDDTPFVDPDPDKQKKLFFSPCSNSVFFRDFFEDSEYREYVPRKANVPTNCTIVRPEQESTTTVTSSEAALQPMPVLPNVSAAMETSTSNAQTGEESRTNAVGLAHDPFTVLATGGADATAPGQTEASPATVAVEGASNGSIEQNTKQPVYEKATQKATHQNQFEVPWLAAIPVATNVNATIAVPQPVNTEKREPTVTAATLVEAINEGPGPSTRAIGMHTNLPAAENVAVPKGANKIPATFAESQKVAHQNPLSVPLQAAVTVPMSADVTGNVTVDVTATGSVTVNATATGNATIDLASPPHVARKKVVFASPVVSGVRIVDEQPGPTTGTIRKQANLPVAVKAAVPKVIAPPHKFLHRVRELFPRVRVSFLEQLCAELVATDPLEYLIEKILNYPDLPIKAEVEINPEFTEVLPKDCKEDAEAAFQAFKEILPDADPEYLESMYKGFAQDADKLKVFVANALEKKDYPTMAQYKKRQAQFALEKRFKDNFDLAEFLELFPDPFTHFRDPLKVVPPKYPCLASRAFLMARYRTLRVTEIDRAYKRNRFMLYPTCKELDPALPTRRRRLDHEITTDRTPKNNLDFLQQIAFIEHEQLIVDHLKQIEDAKVQAVKDKEKAFAEAKKMGELLTCGCCFDDEVLGMDMVTCEEGHLFCKECVKKGAEVQIGQGKTDFPCLEDCGAKIRLETLETVLLPSVFGRLVQRKQIEEVKAAGIECFETCPFCDFGMVPHPDDRVFSCQNPECLKESCRLCKEVSHIPFRCDEMEKSDETKARTYIEDKMTEALVRTCWKCQKKFVKSDGCNKMTCSCGALMCYVCRQPVKDYSHFNGQGGDAFEKCPLYSHNNQLHVDAVAEVARKAKEEMAAKNPALSLKHDPTLILPEKVPENGHQPNGEAWVRYPLPAANRGEAADNRYEIALAHARDRLAREDGLQYIQGAMQVAGAGRPLWRMILEDPVPPAAPVAHRRAHGRAHVPAYEPAPAVAPAPPLAPPVIPQAAPIPAPRHAPRHAHRRAHVPAYEPAPAVAPAPPLAPPAIPQAARRPAPAVAPAQPLAPPAIPQAARRPAPAVAPATPLAPPAIPQAARRPAHAVGVPPAVPAKMPRQPPAWRVVDVMYPSL